MPKHYKQGRNARLDESLGMRRGKESTKKQSFKDRRDESRGMRRHNAEMHEAADTQMYHKGAAYYGPGYGQPQNMPTSPMTHKYPAPMTRFEDKYPDTLEEIDRDMIHNSLIVERYPSDSMY